MKLALVTAGLGALLCVSLAGAAPTDVTPPPPAPVAPAPQDTPDKPPGADHDHDHDRDHHPHFPPGGQHQPGFFPHVGGEHGDNFRHLSDEERQRVRDAFNKVWSNTEVMQARDELMKANDHYRETLHHALQEADPEVAKILEKMMPDGPPGGPGGMGGGPGGPGGRPHPGGPMPDPSDPEFPRKVGQRLMMELQGMMPPSEHRDGSNMRMHERLMQVAAVRDALKEVEQSDPPHRPEAWKHLHEVYQAAAKAEVARLKESQQPAAAGAPSPAPVPATPAVTPPPAPAETPPAK